MEEGKLKILILHARVGNGHYKAAEVIRDKIEHLYPNATVYFEDGLEESSRVINFIAIKGYKNILKYLDTNKIYNGYYWYRVKFYEDNIVPSLNKN